MNSSRYNEALNLYEQYLNLSNELYTTFEIEYKQIYLYASGLFFLLRKTSERV